MDSLRQQLLTAYQQLLVLYQKLAASQPQSNADKLIMAARAANGKNLSIGTGVPYEVACAISCNIVHTNAFGFPIGGGASTHDMNIALASSVYFKEVPSPVAGCMAIDPSGSGTNPLYPHGHVGIFDGTGFWANDSDTGIWRMKYPSLAAWVHQFETVEGYKTRYFLRI